MLLARIKSERIIATKDKNAQRKSILTTLLGEVERVNSKGATDEEVQKVAKKLADKIQEGYDIIVDNRCDSESDLQALEQAKFELEVLQEFYPKTLSESEIQQHVERVIAETGAESMRDMGKVMGVLSKIQGMDNGLANQIIRKLLG